MWTDMKRFVHILIAQKRLSNCINDMEIFLHTDEMAKWRSISFCIPRDGLDVFSIFSCYIEYVAAIRLRSN